MGKLFRVYLREDGFGDEKLYQNYRKRKIYYKIQKETRDKLKTINALENHFQKKKQNNNIPWNMDVCICILVFFFIFVFITVYMDE